jgi:hypothetical protein
MSTTLTMTAFNRSVVGAAVGSVAPVASASNVGVLPFGSRCGHR